MDRQVHCRAIPQKRCICLRDRQGGGRTHHANLRLSAMLPAIGLFIAYTHQFTAAGLTESQDRDIIANEVSYLRR